MLASYRDYKSACNILYDGLELDSGWGPPGVPVKNLKIKLVSGEFFRTGRSSLLKSKTETGSEFTLKVAIKKR